jgi:hypothetical protein
MSSQAELTFHTGFGGFDGYALPYSLRRNILTHCNYNPGSFVSEDKWCR